MSMIYNFIYFKLILCTLKSKSKIGCYELVKDCTISSILSTYNVIYSTDSFGHKFNK